MNEMPVLKTNHQGPYNEPEYDSEGRIRIFYDRPRTNSLTAAGLAAIEAGIGELIEQALEITEDPFERAGRLAAESLIEALRGDKA